MLLLSPQSSESSQASSFQSRIHSYLFRRSDQGKHNRWVYILLSGYHKIEQLLQMPWVFCSPARVTGSHPLRNRSTQGAYLLFPFTIPQISSKFEWLQRSD
jgi:hypothetical protein